MRQLAKQVVSDCLKINGYKPGDVWQLRQLAKQVVSDCLKVNGYMPGDVCVGGPASLDRAEKDHEQDSSLPTSAPTAVQTVGTGEAERPGAVGPEQGEVNDDSGGTHDQRATQTIVPSGRSQLVYFLIVILRVRCSI